MPFWQRELLRDSVGMTFNQTYELDLPKNGQLAGLALYIRSAANAAALSSLLRWRLFEYISKIEVIGDGAEIIKSFDGRQALASAFYDDMTLPLGKWGNTSGVTHRQIIPLNFGRWLQDELYGLDLSRWNQVTLKITNDATATQFTTNISLTVVAYWLRESAAPFLGYFREEEWKIWAPATNVWEYNELPVALPIRRILLRARPAVDNAPVNQNLNTITSQMADIDFNARSGQTRLYRGPFEVLGWLSTSELRHQVESAGEALPASDDYVNVDMGYVTAAVWSASAGVDPVATFPGTVFASDIQLSSQQNWVVAASAPGEFRAQGYAFMHQLPIWNARKPDLSDLLHPRDLATVNLDIQATSAVVVGGNANAESAIVLSRLVGAA